MKTEELKTNLEEIKFLLKGTNEKPLSFNEAADYLGISHSYLYKLTAQNKIPHYKPQGKLIFFNKIELNEFIYGKRVMEDGRNQKSDNRDQKSENSDQKGKRKAENRKQKTGKRN